jgi:two-component system, sensor histidine kinase and response regulator
MESTGNILVIDDEEGIRRGCRRVLEPRGFTLETAATFEEGARLVEQGAFDLVLLDVMLPDGRGLDLLAPVQAKDPDTVCVIITGYATVELAVEAIKHGAYDFISKPFTSDALLMTVNRGLERRRLSLEAKRLQAVEREAAELARAKEEAERLGEFKSAFLRTVAHELRSPVASAQSLLRPLIRGMAGELDERQREMLVRIEARLGELSEMVDDLLDLSAIKMMAPDQPLHSVPLGPVMQRVAERFAGVAQGKQVALACPAPSRPLAVQAVEGELERALGNLVGNAVKYTPAGGHVRVEVQNGHGQVRIAVSDTGIGIPADALAHLGEEFFRAQNAREAGITGTGLGLSIVKQIVNHFGGQFEAHSVVGQGTTFTLTLAAAAPGGAM